MTKDEPTLLYQRGLRDFPTGVVRQGVQCSWKGYGRLKHGLMRFLGSPFEDARDRWTNFARVIQLWNLQNRVDCKGRDARTRFQRYGEADSRSVIRCCNVYSFNLLIYI